MKAARIDQQRHGYVGGHRLLASSIKLPREDQDVIDRLSDIGGQPGPNEAVPDYLTGYPLPSGSHFAFARTWYDPTAPRAGCVLTHTLLIPTETWSSAKSILSLLRLHVPFERERAGRALPPIELVESAREPYPVCLTKGLAELCEAVFLEARQPIVWFTEPNDKTVLRLVEALWPAMRAKFAFQSYALKPRSKADGLFDLMVAPRSARSRFSSWEGRRVEGSAEPRHEFTPLLVKSIFGVPHPDLDAADPLGVLSQDQIGDASKLRLSILWNSLRGSGDADPTAALGMLDVLTAASLPENERWKRAEPLFRRVFEAACSEEGHTANLIGLALGKLERGDAQRLFDSVTRAMDCLSKSEPHIGVRLASTPWRDPSAESILSQSVARALSALSPERIWSAIQNASHEVSVALLKREPKIIVELAGLPDANTHDWEVFASLLEGLDDATLDSVRMNVLERIRTGAQAPLVERLLADLPRAELATALRRLDRSGALRDALFVEAFAELRRPTKEDKLEALADAHLPGTRSRPALEALLEPVGKDLDWLLCSQLPQGLKADLLARVINSSTHDQRRRAGLDRGQRLEAALTALLATERGLEAAALLLVEARQINDTTEALAVARFGPDRLPRSREVLAALIAKVTPVAKVPDADRLLRILETPAGAKAVPLVAPSLVDLLAPEYARDEERIYSLALMLASRLPQPLRKQFIAELPLFAARVSSYRIYELAAPAYDAWAKLVQEAVEERCGTGLIAAQSTLAYVFTREWSALLPLALVSFPSVFNETLAAPHRRVRDAENLARAVCRLFLRHGWDGAALIKMILQTDDHGIVLKALLDCWGGEDYLRKSFARLGVKLSKSDIRSHDVSTWHVGYDGAPHDAAGLLVAFANGSGSKRR